MAQLINWLAFAGARTSAGNAVGSGQAWFYQPGGGTTLATVYSDVNGIVVATNPVALDAGGKAKVYVSSPVRIVVQDSTGANVTDFDQADVNRAEAVQLVNTGWTDSYLDGVLTKLYTSTGGPDGQYQESGGATARTIKSKFSELSISVKDFGAKGDGLAVDTTAVQAAINRVGFLGGGIVYFPPGTYLIDVGLTVSTTGTTLVGAGSKGTTLTSANASINLLTFTAAANVGVRSMGLTSSVGSTGNCIAITSATTTVNLFDVAISSYATCLSLTTCQAVILSGCQFTSTNIGGSRAIKATAVTGLTVIGGSLRGKEYAIELFTTTNNVWVGGVNVSASSGTAAFRFDAALTGVDHAFIGNSAPSGSFADWFSVGAATEPPGLTTFGNTYKVGSASQAVGTSMTPNFSNSAREYDMTASSGGAGTITVNAPVPTPSKGYRFFTVHVNAAGGAVTWTMNPIYVLDGATAIPTTDLHTIIVEWMYDGTKIREVGRSNGLT